MKKWLALWMAFSAPVLAQIELPTPASHFEDYDPEQEAQALLLQLAVALPEESRSEAMAIFQRAKEGDGGVQVTDSQVRHLIDSANWAGFRPQILRLLLHGSRVLDVVPADAQEWLPLVHDSLLLFLDRLSEERLIERLVAQARLPRNASRGERALAFIINTPSLQKLAQILARNQAIDPDLRSALQTVENGLSTARYAEVLEQVRTELGDELTEEYELEFADRLTAEASVGAILEVTFRLPDSEGRGRAACKVLKPYAVSAMKDDLEIIDGILAYLEENPDAYNIGATPLVDIFVEIREALSREVRVKDERENLLRAAEYYASEPRVIVPEVYPFSTENVTCMEFIKGVKISDAFPGQVEARAKLARRLSDALTYDVLFSSKDRALFHGDPHAGNVFHVEDGGSDPYRIALLDWGLAAEFDRGSREKMVQLMLGLYLRNAKRIANNVDTLVDWKPESEEDVKAMKTRARAILEESDGEGMFALLDELIANLARDGYSVRFDTTMFIKAQLTISGILAELDPEFRQDDYVMKRLTGQVYSEFGTRFLRTLWFPAWNSHDYTSMMSNEDVKDVQMKKLGRGFKKVGSGIWKGVTFQWLF